MISDWMDWKKWPKTALSQHFDRLAWRSTRYPCRVFNVLVSNRTSLGHLADHVAFLQASLSIFLQTSCLPQCLGYQSCWYATWHTTRMSAKPKKTYPSCLACDDMLERTSTTCCPKWSVWYKQHYSILKLGGQTLLIFISHGLRFAFRTHQKYPHFRAIDWFWQYVGLALCWQEKCKSI